MNVVWFKRDIRLRDHTPLCEALAGENPVLLVYIFEPSVQKYPDWSWRHAQFQYFSLQAMNEELEKYGVKVHIFFGEAKDVFTHLLETFQVSGVYSHQETGNKLTYDRDIAMTSFFKEKDIPWYEYQCNGVQRGRQDRKDWSEAWENYMQMPLQNPDLGKLPFIDYEVPVDFWATYNHQKKFKEYPTRFQPAGEGNAWKYLKSFFSKRCQGYLKHISEAEASRQFCSRLSPYLAWGNLSSRQVYQYCQKKLEQNFQKRNLEAFSARLRWRCHFVQKFEMEERYEFEHLNQGYATLEQPIIPEYIEAWKQGKTGFPIVDASMRCVMATGYLNFRMRAMLVSFLTHVLWQPWQSGVHHLAKYFLDYETGIHYCQFQMQAGVLGTNTIRVYNPVKQSQEQDEKGVFIRQWLPELSSVPTALLHEPWKMTAMEQEMYHCKLGIDYPLPIVELKTAMKKASEILWAFRKTPEVLQENKRILRKHVEYSIRDEQE
jgi:deoxyribodipyrimidine photo-lyase